MVEELKVDPGDLDSAAGRLTSLSGDNAQTETYLNQWLDLPRSEGGLVLSGVIDAQPTAPAPQQPVATPEPPLVAPNRPPGQTAGTTLPGTRRPNREQVVIPDEPDDDDLYFQQRNQRGWLE